VIIGPADVSAGGIAPWPHARDRLASACGWPPSRHSGLGDGLRLEAIAQRHALRRLLDAFAAYPCTLIARRSSDGAAAFLDAAALHPGPIEPHRFMCGVLAGDCEYWDDRDWFPSQLLVRIGSIEAILAHLRRPEGGVPHLSGGRPERCDWPAVRDAVFARLDRIGPPSQQNIAGWQTKADVARWIEGLPEGGGVTVGDSAGFDTIRKRVREMLTDWEKQVSPGLPRP
jgi:hypothetical protein